MLRACLSTSAFLGNSMKGTWKGKLELQPGVAINLVFRVPQESGPAYFDSPDQMAMDIPAIVENSFGEVKFSIPHLNGSFVGDIRGDDVIAGHWIQGPAKLPLSIERTSEPTELNRPQNPKAPFLYENEEIKVKGSRGAVLVGTLTTPFKPARNKPLVLLIAGSGPQNRDENVFGHRIFSVWADHLSRHGIATFRYDKRGVDDSTGIFRSSSVRDFAADAACVLRYLQERVDDGKIGFLGHSEGAYVGPAANVLLKRPVDFAILKAGMTQPAYEVLTRQAEQSARDMKEEEWNPALFEFTRATFKSLSEMSRRHWAELDALGLDASERDYEAANLAFHEKLKGHVRSILEGAPEKLKGSLKSERLAQLFKDNIEKSVAGLSDPGLVDLLACHPSDVLGKLTCPVLHIGGRLDHQVHPDNIEGTRDVVGSSDVTTRVFERHNHLLQPCTTGAFTEYVNISTTVDPAVLSFVHQWILHRTATMGGSSKGRV